MTALVLGIGADHAKQVIRDGLIEHEHHLATRGGDLPEIRDWTWTSG